MILFIWDGSCRMKRDILGLMMQDPIEGGVIIYKFFMRIFFFPMERTDIQIVYYFKIGVYLDSHSVYSLKDN